MPMPIRANHLEATFSTDSTLQRLIESGIVDLHATYLGPGCRLSSSFVLSEPRCGTNHPEVSWLMHSMHESARLVIFQPCRQTRGYRRRDEKMAVVAELYIFGAQRSRPAPLSIGHRCRRLKQMAHTLAVSKVLLQLPARAGRRMSSSSSKPTPTTCISSSRDSPRRSRMFTQDVVCPRPYTNCLKRISGIEAGIKRCPSYRPPGPSFLHFFSRHGNPFPIVF